MYTETGTVTAIFAADELETEMPITLTLRDESVTGEITNELIIECLTERMTVQELIQKSENISSSEEVQLANQGRGWDSISPKLSSNLRRVR